MPAFFYSPSTESFYIDIINPIIPEDAIELSQELHQSLLTEMNQNNKKISIVDGELTLVDRPVIMTWEIVRFKRNKLLMNTDYTDTLSFKARNGDSVYDLWQTYRQALRDLPQSFDSPESVVWPTKPGD